MLRQIAIITATGLAALVSLNAGQVQIGQTIGGVNDGLTTAWALSGCVAANGPSWNGCANTSAQTLNTTNVPSLKNYDTNLFSSVSSGSVYSGYPSGPGTMGNANVTFAMIDDSTVPNQNYWALQNTSTPLTIPIGIFGVQNVWTMLNDVWGCTAGNQSGPCAGASNADTVIKFTFDKNSNGNDAASLETVTFTLINGNEIRDAVDCTSGGACSTLGYATGLAALSNMTPTIGGSAGITFPSGINVATGTLYSPEYSAGATGSGNYNSTTGTLALDYQEFQFGNAFLNDYLVKASVSNPNSASSQTRTGFSAITLDVAAPEPSTVLLVMAGLGFLGVKRMRRS